VLHLTYLSFCGFAFVLSCFFGFADGGRLGLAGFFVFVASGNPILRTGKFIFGPSASSETVDGSEMSGIPIAASFAFC
jgi:hypothetical protein